MTSPDANAICRSTCALQIEVSCALEIGVTRRNPMLSSDRSAVAMLSSHINKLKRYDGLLDEPVSDFDDGYRVEIVTPRALFLFKIGQTSCSVAYRDIEYSVMHAQVKTRPESMWKRTSNVSILTVYDTHGLDVTLLFLEYLVKRCELDLNSQWIQAYLYACLHIIQGNLCSCMIGCSNENARRIASEIGRELRALDRDVSETGRLESAPCDLPVDVLAKIVNSVRVSKGVRAAVLVIRRDSEPSLEELHDSGLPCTSLAVPRDLDLHYFIVDGRRQWNVTIGHNSQQCVVSITRPAEGQASYLNRSFSIRQYVRCMQARRCANVNERVSRMLESLISDQTLPPGAWIAQLSCELDQPEKTFFSDGMRDELVRLIEIAKMVDWSHAPSAELWAHQA